MKKVFLTVSYIAVIVLIVFLADRQSTAFIFNWIREIPGGDKVGHFLLIGGLAFVVNYSLYCRTIVLRNHRLMLGSVVVAVLVTSEEFSQLYIHSRTFDFVDLLCDWAGIWAFGKLALRATKREESHLQQAR
jgi:hypothetical protein